MSDRNQRFQSLVAPHLPAARRLARWLLREPGGIDDVVQEACRRALSFIDGLKGDGPQAKAWFLTIVRRVAFDRGAIQTRYVTAGDDVAWFERPTSDPSFPGPALPRDPEQVLIAKAEAADVRSALASLADEARTILVLREVEDLSYREIAEVLDVPIGTVMSRLARAREALRRALLNGLAKDQA